MQTPISQQKIYLKESEKIIVIGPNAFTWQGFLDFLRKGFQINIEESFFSQLKQEAKNNEIISEQMMLNAFKKSCSLEEYTKNYFSFKISYFFNKSVNAFTVCNKKQLPAQYPRLTDEECKQMLASCFETVITKCTNERLNEACLVEMANATIKPQENTSVFYTGINKNAAEEFAKSNNLYTLGNTPAGDCATRTGVNQDCPLFISKFWVPLSENFARRTSGEIYAFVPQINKEKTFWSCEKDIIQNNPDINNISFVTEDCSKLSDDSINSYSTETSSGFFFFKDLTNKLGERSLTSFRYSAVMTLLHALMPDYYKKATMLAMSAGLSYYETQSLFSSTAILALHCLPFNISCKLALANILLTISTSAINSEEPFQALIQNIFLLTAGLLIGMLTEKSLSYGLHFFKSETEDNSEKEIDTYETKRLR